jgi:hypothetical protein
MHLDINHTTRLTSSRSSPYPPFCNSNPASNLTKQLAPILVPSLCPTLRPPANPAQRGAFKRPLPPWPADALVRSREQQHSVRRWGPRCCAEGRLYFSPLNSPVPSQCVSLCLSASVYESSSLPILIYLILFISPFVSLFVSLALNVTFSHLSLAVSFSVYTNQHFIPKNAGLIDHSNSFRFSCIGVFLFWCCMNLMQSLLDLFHCRKMVGLN